MSWEGTYSHTLLIALDQFGAAVLFNRPDLTISTLCDLVMTGQAAPLKLSLWQLEFLAWLGPKLNRLQKNHCPQARLGDLQRAESTIALLKPPDIPQVAA